MCCDGQVLDGLGLGDSELPLIVIVDTMMGMMAECERPDVSVEVIEQFVDDYKADLLKWIRIPPITQVLHTFEDRWETNAIITDTPRSSWRHPIERPESGTGNEHVAVSRCISQS